MVFEMTRSLLGLNDPKVDIWGKLAAVMVSIKDLGKLAIRIDSWEWVIHRCARYGQHLTCLSLGGWYPRSVTRKNLSVTMGQARKNFLLMARLGRFTA